MTEWGSSIRPEPRSRGFGSAGRCPESSRDPISTGFASCSRTDRLARVPNVIACGTAKTPEDWLDQRGARRNRARRHETESERCGSVAEGTWARLPFSNRPYPYSPEWVRHSGGRIVRHNNPGASCRAVRR